MPIYSKKKDLPKAVVLGLGINGLGVARSLGRKGISVIGVDHRIFNLGHFSKYCRHLISPDVGKSEKFFLDFLLQIGKKSQLPAVLLPTEDIYVIFVSRHRDTLDRYYRFALPDKSLCEAVLNKYAFFELAKRHSLSVPATYSLKSIDDLKGISKNLEFPCIIKPLYSRKWKLGGLIKAVKVSSKKELIKVVEEFTLENNEIVIQELVPGKDCDQFSYAAYLNSQGECKAEFIARKIRQHPLGFGVGTLIESIHDTKVSEMGATVLRKLGVKGIAEVEFRKSEKSGELKLIEINLRPWTQNTLAAYCGMDIIYFSYLDLIGEPIPKCTSYKTGVKWINIFRDPIAAFQYVFKKEVSIMEWIRSFRKIKDFSIFATDDLFPFLFLPLYIVYYFIRGVGNE